MGRQWDNMAKFITWGFILKSIKHGMDISILKHDMTHSTGKTRETITRYSNQQEIHGDNST